MIVLARRKGENWYVGAMTDWEAREIALGLDFLGVGEYEARVFADGPDAAMEATSLAIGKKRVMAGDTLDLRLAPGGGAAVILTPKR
jgi:alpha-glucosidase